MKWGGLADIQIFSPSYRVCQTSRRPSCAKWMYVHPGRLTWNRIMEAWKIIFLSKWVICRFQPFIFQSVNVVLKEVCFAAKLPTSLPAGLEEPAVVPALLALEHPRQCPGSVEVLTPRGERSNNQLMCEISRSHQMVISYKWIEEFLTRCFKRSRAVQENVHIQ